MYDSWCKLLGQEIRCNQKWTSVLCWEMVKYTYCSANLEESEKPMFGARIETYDLGYINRGLANFRPNFPNFVTVATRVSRCKISITQFSQNVTNFVNWKSDKVTEVSNVVCNETYNFVNDWRHKTSQRLCKQSTVLIHAENEKIERIIEIRRNTSNFAWKVAYLGWNLFTPAANHWLYTLIVLIVNKLVTFDLRRRLFVNFRPMMIIFIHTTMCKDRQTDRQPECDCERDVSVRMDGAVKLESQWPHRNKKKSVVVA